MVAPRTPLLLIVLAFAITDAALLQPHLVCSRPTAGPCTPAQLWPRTRSSARRVATASPPCMSAAATAAWVGGCVLSGTAGVPSVVGATKTWYRKIPLPTWTPPDRVFAPVWTSLYAMMGLATARVAAAAGVLSAPVVHFLAHLCVNLLWAPIFFGLQRLRLALLMNVALIASLSVLLGQYGIAAASPSALLLCPYMGWLLFATALNFAICRLNPTARGYNNARWQADLAKLQKRAASIAAA